MRSSPSRLIKNMSDCVITPDVSWSQITVLRGLNPRQGWLVAGQFRLKCALGKGGITAKKREGDGSTPRGSFALRQLWFRDDRRLKPMTRLPMRRIRDRDGWCDAANHPRYNRPVILPFKASHETMRRDDHLYDIVIEIGWNDRPTIRGRGSAIFMHLARPGYTPTEGCVALARRDMDKLISRLGPKTKIIIQ